MEKAIERRRYVRQSKEKPIKKVDNFISKTIIQALICLLIFLFMIFIKGTTLFNNQAFSVKAKKALTTTQDLQKMYLSAQNFFMTNQIVINSKNFITNNFLGILKNYNKAGEWKINSSFFYIHPSMLVLVAASIVFGFFESFLMVYLITFFHEAGHLICGVFFKINPKIIKVMPFGLSIKFSNEYLITPKKEAIIAFAGPFVNAVMLLFAPLLKNAFLDKIFILYFYSNIFMLIINLLPIIPLDGGRILKALLTIKIGPIKAISYSLLVSKTIAIFLFFFGAFVLYVSKFNFSVLLISSFIFYYLIDESKNHKLLLIKVLINYKEKFKNKAIIKVKHLAVCESTMPIKLLKKLSLNYFYIINVLNKDMKIIASMAESELIDAIIKKDSPKSFKEIIKN